MSDAFWKTTTQSNGYPHRRRIRYCRACSLSSLYALFAKKSNKSVAYHGVSGKNPSCQTVTTGIKCEDSEPRSVR